MYSASMSSRCSETKALWRIFQMESQKIRIWRELPATCDKTEKNRTFDRSGDISSIVQN